MYLPPKAFFSLGGAMLAKPMKNGIEDINFFPCITQPKFDGVRAIYFPVEKELYTRNGNLITGCPSILLKLNKLNLKFPVDGELLAKGLSFNDANGIVRRTSNISDQENLVYYVIFDVVTNGSIKERLATLPGETKVFTERALTTNKQGEIYVSPTKTKFKPEHVEREFKTYLEEEFEGIIVRNSTSPYEYKRTKNLLKLKEILYATGVVIGFENGKGRLTNTLGNIVLRANNGKVFSVGSGLSDDLRIKLWKRGFKTGDTVQYSYQELSSKQVPRFPILIDYYGDGI